MTWSTSLCGDTKSTNLAITSFHELEAWADVGLQYSIQHTTIGLANIYSVWTTQSSHPTLMEYNWPFFSSDFRCFYFNLKQQFTPLFQKSTDNDLLLQHIICASITKIKVEGIKTSNVQ